MRDPLFFLNDESNNGARGHEQQIPTRDSYYTPQYDFEQDRSTYSTKAPLRHNNFTPGQQSTTATMGGVKPTVTVGRKGPSGQHRRDRERQLLNTPAETLVKTLIAQEHDAKESRKLLRNAIARLDSMRNRTDMAEDARRTLEGEQRARGWQVTQSVMDAQGEIVRAKNDAEVYRLQLEWTQRELRQKQDAVKAIEQQRDKADKEATQAREVARQLHDEGLVAKAREEGRRLGFMEGMHQGRALALEDEMSNRSYHTPLGSGQAYIEEYEEDDDIDHPPNSRRRHVSREGTPRGPPAPITPSQPATAPPSPADDVARLELEAAKQREEEMMRREAEQRETIRQLELRELQRQRDVEADRYVARARERRLEREKQEIQVAWQREILGREAARQREVQEAFEQQRARERELERQRNEERRVREEKEQELQREREKVLSLERQRAAEHVRERTGSTTSNGSKTSTRLVYLPMPPPPPKHSTPAARHNTIATPESANTVPLPIPPPSRSSQRASSLRSEPPQQIQPSPFPPGAHQPSSPDTLRSDASITTGVSNLDIVTFPTPTRRGWPSTLSDIPEVPSVRSHSRSSMNEEPSPSPSRALADQWRRSIGGSNLTSPATPVRDMLSPTFQARGRTNERANGDQARRASSGSTIHIHVEPPSRPPSSAGIRDPEQRGFLSPNSRPLALVPEEPTGPPVIPDMGSLSPQGFVPSSMTLSESSDQRSRGHGRQGSRTGSNIYANATPPVQSSTNMFAHGGSRQQPSARNSIYGNAPPPQGPYNSSSIASLTPREVPRQLYAAPSPSAAGPQPLPTGSPSGPGFQPLPTNLSRPRQIYAPSPSVTGNQPLPTDLSGTRQIYASSPSVIGSQPLPVDLSRPQIYAPSPSVTGSQPLPSRQRQIYAPSPSVSGTQPLPADALPTAVGQRGAAASRTSIYGPPIASSAGSQTPAQGARQFYGLPVNISAGSQTPAQGTRQLYSLPASSSAGSHTPAQGARPLYAPAPSLQGTHTNGPPSIYGPPPASGDATSRNGPVIPPPSTYPIFVPPAPSPSLPTMPLGPSSRTGPVIPGVTVYSPSQPPPQEPVIPFIPPIPGSMTPSGSNIQLNVTPRARFAEIAEDPNEDSPIVHDEETMRNTHINKLGGSPLRVPLQPPLPVPPPSVPVPTPGPSMPIPTPAPATRKNKKGRR